MNNSINTPYVKKFNKIGNLINPIKEIYKTDGENRIQRREKISRFRGNTKGISLTVTESHRFKRFIQIISFFNKHDGVTEKRRILHYVPC